MICGEAAESHTLDLIPSSLIDLMYCIHYGILQVSSISGSESSDDEESRARASRSRARQKGAQIAFGQPGKLQDSRVKTSFP